MSGNRRTETRQTLGSDLCYGRDLTHNSTAVDPPPYVVFCTCMVLPESENDEQVSIISLSKSAVLEPLGPRNDGRAANVQNKIVVSGARLHNLRNVTVEIPKNRLVVLTGVSGSGKSTLALDTLYKEAGRQYMEALGLVTDGMSKPPVESITGLSPSVSVDQHLTNRSPRSTVGTATEIYTYLRVLFARLGHRPCPHCGQDIPPASEVESDQWEDDGDSRTAMRRFLVLAVELGCPR